MRFLYGVVAGFIWVIFIGAMMKEGAVISNDIQCLSIAVIVAGAMAGGD